jgi:hypothetical protein
VSDRTITHRSARAQWEVTSPALRASVVPFLVSRAIVLVALGAARLSSGIFKLGAAAHNASYSGLLGWDARWYDKIAAQGYENLGKAALRFFPLLPVLARSLRAVPGMTAGMSVVAVANVASLAAFAALYRLVVVELGDEACARRAVWLLALAPPAFVLVMGYAESLLLLTSLVTFLGLRQHRYALAICAAVAAGLCRPIGMLLVVPAAIEVYNSWPVLGGRERVLGVGSVLAAPAGAVAYLAWSEEVIGSFLLPLREQLARSRRGAAADPVVTFARDARDLVQLTHLGTAEHAFWAVVLLALAVFIVRRLPAAYGWYTVAVLVVVLTASNLESLERYGLGCFPFAIAAAMLTSRRMTYRVVIVLSGLLLVGYATAAFLGKYVP